MKTFIPKDIKGPINFSGPYVAKYKEIYISIVDDIMMEIKPLYSKIFVYPDGTRCIFFFKEKSPVIPEDGPDMTKFKEIKNEYNNIK